MVIVTQWGRHHGLSLSAGCVSEANNRLLSVHCSCLTVSVVDLQVTEPTSEVPDHIRPNHLIKELTKEIRYLEVRRDEEEI